MGLLLSLCRSHLSVVFSLIQQLFVRCQNDSFKSCLILLVQAVYTCLIVFAGRCAVDRIKFTLFGFYWFHVAQCSALQLLPPSAHIPCTLPVCWACRTSHNICNSGIHFYSLCFVLFGIVKYVADNPYSVFPMECWRIICNIRPVN